MRWYKSRAKYLKSANTFVYDFFSLSRLKCKTYSSETVKCIYKILSKLKVKLTVGKFIIAFCNNLLSLFFSKCHSAKADEKAQFGSLSSCFHF